MDQPIIFVSHWDVRPGALDRLRQQAAETAARFRAEKPRTLSWLAYLDDSHTRISFVHVFADAEAMDLHIQGARPAQDLIEPRGWEVYGAPSDAALAMMGQRAEAAGVTLKLEPEVVAGGFLRLAAE